MSARRGITRRQALEQKYRRSMEVRVDRLFAWLIAGQYALGLVVALTISPLAWEGTKATVHDHVLAAALLGGAVLAAPLAMIRRYPGTTATRHTVALGEALYCGLLIHLFGGRIEAHFHVFGVLAFLACYRDWKVVVTASAVTAVDHALRGLVWPESIFGTAEARPLQWLEHTAWVVCEDVVLIYSCVLGRREIAKVSDREATLEETKSGIEAIVEARTRDLEEARIRAESASRAKTSFLANTSHELRTPMNGIIGTAQLLRDTRLDEGQRESLETMIRCGDDLLILINELLDLSKIESGRMDVEEAPFDLRACAAHVVDLVQPRVRAGVEISVTVAEDLHEAYLGDGPRVRQVLINLVGNAAKFTHEGRIDVSLSVGGEVDDCHVVEIEVADTGIGIPADKADTIFDSFTQIDDASTRAYGGTGLGLAISKSLVEKMGGSISVESRLGEGSAFTCVLPLRDVAATDDSEGDATDRPTDGLEGLRVLLVEDNPVNVRVAERILERVGCDVTVARNGAEGVDAARDGGHDVILMDLQMPVMGGLEAAATLVESWNERGVTPTPIVALTADAMEVHRRECEAVGMSDFLTKPIRIEDLEAALGRWAPESRRRAA